MSLLPIDKAWERVHLNQEIDLALPWDCGDEK
jgi:hypothetical protein